MIYLTPEGKQKLEKELNELIARRPIISKRIQVAKDMGDLKENADYHDAKDEQGMVEARIREIEAMLNQAEVVNKTSGETITLGSKIKIITNGKEREMQIVGANEASPLEGKISNESPIGRALMRRKVGEKIEIDIPAGKVIYEIKEID
ncbi:transcription elongation factor GreA [Candidatus Parcubacteria bacterium]|nr:transcription elongation factor GreA [Patescibacteria group bacterium]MCG2693814.1 transcription elongation factor GreA [Candidatus Parcubacteria bacterium]